MRSAPLFQLRMTPSSDLLMTASSADSMMAESQKGAKSARSRAPGCSASANSSGAGVCVWSSGIGRDIPLWEDGECWPLLRGKDKDVKDYTDAARLFPRGMPSDLLRLTLRNARAPEASSRARGFRRGRV